MIENQYFISDSFRSISLRKDVRRGYRGGANSLYLTDFLPDYFSASAVVSAEMLCFYKSSQYCRRGLTGFEGYTSSLLISSPQLLRPLLVFTYYLNTQPKSSP